MSADATLAAVALVVLGLSQAPPGPGRSGTAELRVMTYNIKHGQTNASCTQPAVTPGQPPPPDCNLDLQAAIAVIRALNPDVVGLQEVDRFWARSAYQDEPAVLSAALGMEHRCYGPNLDHPPDHHSDRQHQYGTLILSRLPITTCGNTLLPRAGEDEQRGLALAVIDVGGVPLNFYNTHLHTTEAARLRQAPSIAAAIGTIESLEQGRNVLVGDFNAQPMATELEPLRARLADGWIAARRRIGGAPDGLTSPAELDGDPRHRIDYVFVPRAGDVRTAQVVIDARTRLASDHYPVVVDLTLPK